MTAPLDVSFYDRPVVEVARDLVGCHVHHEGAAGRIVETEAYHFSEAACHAHAGLTPRTRVLHGPPGHAYVYLSYGIHSLLNAVTEADGVGAAVLIRALEPVADLDAMARRRGRDAPRELCNGPGKLTQALGIGLGLNGSRLDGPIAIVPGDGPPPRLAVGTRIGITKAVDLPWRFCDADSACVSAPRPRPAATA